MNVPRRPADMLAVVGVKLSTLPRRVVFVGGATTELLITDTAAAPVRSTIDVDVIVDVDSRAQYMTTLRDELLELGARVDTSDDAPTCRWILDGVRVDVMPPREDVLGFTNRWYSRSWRRSQPRSPTCDRFWARLSSDGWRAEISPTWSKGTCATLIARVAKSTYSRAWRVSRGSDDADPGRCNHVPPGDGAARRGLLALRR